MLEMFLLDSVGNFRKDFFANFFPVGIKLIRYGVELIDFLR
jgi:hypothetical protein